MRIPPMSDTIASRYDLATDVETVLDVDRVPPARIAELRRREAEEGRLVGVRPYEWKIVTIGHVLVEHVGRDTASGVRIERLGEIGTPDWREADMLAGFFKIVAAKRPRLVTWNGRGFDLPVVIARAVALGVPALGFHQRRYLHRYATEAHVDVMDMLSLNGAGTRMDLDGYAHACGLAGKPPGIHGGDVQRLMEEGRRADVVEYCAGYDCPNTLALWWRWQLHAGDIGPDAYDARMAALGEAIAAKFPAAGAAWRWTPAPRDVEPWRPSAAVGGDEKPPRDIRDTAA